MSDEKILPSPLNPRGEATVDSATAAAKRHAVIDEIGWLERLTESADFRRYVEAMKAESDLARRKIDAIETLTAEQSGRYAQKFIAQLDMAEWADRQLKFLREKIKNERKVQP